MCLFLSSFQMKLKDIFRDIHDVYKAIEGRLKAEQFKVSVIITRTVIICITILIKNCIAGVFD